MSNQITWIYTSKSNQSFFSHIGSSAQRLPNGNTLICADTEGHLFEVTAAGDLVWEYINPVTKEGPVKTLPDSYPMTNSVFRAYRYAADHPAFVGHDMTPGDPITGGSGATTPTPQPSRTRHSAGTATPTATAARPSATATATPPTSTASKLPDTGQIKSYTRHLRRGRGLHHQPARLHWATARSATR